MCKLHKFVNLLCKPKGLQLIDKCPPWANSCSCLQLAYKCPPGAVSAAATQVSTSGAQLPCSCYTDKCPPTTDGLSATHIHMPTAHVRTYVRILLSTCYVNLKAQKICAICHIDKRVYLCYDIMGKSKFEIARAMI